MPRKSKYKYTKGEKRIIKPVAPRKGRGVDLTDAQKQHLKDGYKKLIKPKQFDKLTRDEQTYLNRIKAGKARASSQNTIRVDGRYVSGKIVPVIKRLAKSKKKTVKAFVKDFKDDMNNLIERGQVINKEFVYTVIDALRKSKNKRIRINADHKTLVTSYRLGRIQAINQLTLLNNRLLGDTRAVAVKVDIAYMLDGSVKVTAPPPPDERITGDSLEFWAEQYEGIELIISY